MHISPASPLAVRAVAGLRIKRIPSASAVGIGLLVSTALAACSDSSSPQPQHPVTPPFVMVADVEGVAQLIRVSGDTSIQLTHSGNDESPASAAGAIAFRSSSLGPTEILVADALGGSQRLATHDTASNDEPSLSPAADSLVYANSKRGVPRLWITAVPPVGDTVRTSLPLMTGSDSTVPERAPAWSPTGGQIAFSSTRTGTSQIYTVGTVAARH